MAECPNAIILSALLISSGSYLFTNSFQKDETCDKLAVLPSFIFLTAVFAWVSVNNIYLFKCKLPAKVIFVYEAVISMFIFEVAMTMFWKPIECFLTSKLPSLLDKYLIGGECVACGSYCPGILFTILVYSTALGSLWTVLHGYGVTTSVLEREQGEEVCTPQLRRSRRVQSRASRT